jgi:glycosyltransferase involved in cell wall biosynthesis
LRQAALAPGKVLMPSVSVIVPCYNEAGTIRSLLGAVAGQTYPADEVEVVIADALSTDGTREEIDAFKAGQDTPEVRVIDNPMRAIPIGLNLALAGARAETIVRLDAHCIPYPDYIERCLAALESGFGDNVGGVWEIKPSGLGWIARSIAAAAAHPLGAGDARYRSGTASGEVDTVPFGAYRKSLVEGLGGYDESLLTNEDYELNVRIRKSGGRIWIDPSIRSIYFARSSFRALARQYWRYGFWKARMLLKHPDTIRWRQLSPLLVLSLGILALLSPWFNAARILFFIEALVYSAALLASGIQTSRREHRAALVLGVPLAIGTMHFAWGTAFLWSLFLSLLRK